MTYSWIRVVAATAALAAAPAAVVRVKAHPVYVVDNAPPEPRAEPAPAPRAGYVWVAGNWEHRGGRWVWRSGHWERTRAQYTWVDGHWEHRGNRYHWVEGYWAAAGAAPAPTVVVRDHEPPPPPPPA